MANPPIVPSADVTLPAIVTSPVGVKWKLEELISMLLLLPLINWLLPPKKNLSVRTFTDEPLRNALDALRTKLDEDAKLPPAWETPNDTKLLSSALNKKLPLLCIKAFQPLL